MLLDKSASLRLQQLRKMARFTDAVVSGLLMKFTCVCLSVAEGPDDFLLRHQHQDELRRSAHDDHAESRNSFCRNCNVLLLQCARQLRLVPILATRFHSTSSQNKFCT